MIAYRMLSPRLRGFTLIELMVAMVLGLLVAAGIVTVFASTSSSNKAQNQLAQLQEAGRFAVTRIGTDLRMANGQYCTNTGGVAKVGTGGTAALDHIRTPKVYAKNLIGAAGAISGALADVTTPWAAGSYPAAPSSAPYSMPSFLFMRGYDCSLTACLPVDPHTTISTIPAMGVSLGDRVKGTDVLTVRYVNPSSGWAVDNVAGSSAVATSGSSGTVTSITLVQQKPLGEPPLSNVTNGDLFMLADCSNAQIFPATFASPTITPLANTTDGFGTGAANLPTAQQPESVPKVFDVNRDFQTVTYYLKLVSANNNGAAPFTGALMRRVNGGLKADGITPAGPGASEDELVRGVERMDFRYGVQDSSGKTSFLSADDVDTSTDCPPGELDALTPNTGCLWRGIKSIEVSLLMDGQVPLYTLTGNQLNYAYSADGNGVLAISAHGIKPADQGFPDPLLRREFNVLVPVRNYNP